MGTAAAKKGLTTELTTAESTGKAGRRKAPKKKHGDFPLTAHKATNRWCKKVRGKVHYFGPWNDGEPQAAQAALVKWLEQKDDLLAGRIPRVQADGLTIEKLVNRFLNDKKALVEQGELSSRTWLGYHRSCRIVAKVLGKSRLVTDLKGEDFAKVRAYMAKSVSPVTLGNRIQDIRVMFNYARRAELIAVPVSYGMGFERPSAKRLREERNKKGERMLEPAELRRLIDSAKQPMKSMILLALNCGYGNNDVGLLPLSAIDLDRGWATFPRPKTAIPRRCPLWAETVTALREWLAERPAPKDEADAGLVFVTVRGASWAKEPKLDGTDKEAMIDNPITKEYRKLVDKLKLYRPGISFYMLRHVFETVAGEVRDQPATDKIMGHVPASNDMAAVYRERISDARLVDVVSVVHDWLFAGDADEGAVTLKVHAPEGLHVDPAEYNGKLTVEPAIGPLYVDTAAVTGKLHVPQPKKRKAK